MKKSNLITTTIFSAITFGLFVISPQGVAHTRFSVPKGIEGERTETAINIPHGCDGKPVIGSVFFLPDNTDSNIQTSTDGFVTFQDVTGSPSDFITQVTVTPIQSRDVFKVSELITDQLDNTIGFWSGDGSLPASKWVGRLPLLLSSASINPDSCARKVRIVPAMANVCTLSKASAPGFKDADSGGLVDLWTPPGNGPFNAPAWNFPANYDIERNLDTNPFPASCDLDGDGGFDEPGETIDVRIFPSNAQMLRNFPVKIGGVQVWPIPE